MNNLMPCGLDDDRLWDQADTIAAAHDKRIEDYADNLMSDCVKIEGAKKINLLFDIYDGEFLPEAMNLIASWRGSTESAVEQMKKLHNLQSRYFQAIAEREVDA